MSFEISNKFRFVFFGKFTFLSNHSLFFLINCLIGNASKNSFAINIFGASDISFKFFKPFNIIYF